MGTYDFYGQLEPMEFQRFARDIIQAREGIHLESFAETGDGGIDGRWRGEKDGTVIIFQAKRIRNRLLAAARSEKEKLSRLVRVDRYIIVFSANASPGTKDRIREELSPYVTRNEDIVFAADLNNYISSRPEIYRRIVENYPKLWVQNASELKRELFEAVNSPLMSRSAISWEDAVKKASIFVETDIYAWALKRLKTSRVLIISGSPGVGKTTLAEHWQNSWGCVSAKNTDFPIIYLSPASLSCMRPVGFLGKRFLFLMISGEAVSWMALRT